jgi:L-asparaginase II
VVRSGLEESIHAVDVAVVDVDGRPIAHGGDPNRLLFARSSMKPLQAAVSMSLMDPALPLTDEEVAVICASHNAEPVHVQAVRSILSKAGLTEDALQCPTGPPWDEVAREADPTPRRINSDCSGKHAGMLATSVAQGWPLDTYRAADHPLQQLVLRTVTAATDAEPTAVGVDGCGVPVHGMPLRRMALLYARLTRPERLGPLGPHARRAVDAMRARPYLVAGRNRVATAVMEAVPTLVVKGGAEALICAGWMDRGWGIAAKVRDGGTRAAGPALLRALRFLGAVDDGLIEALVAHARTPVLGGGRPVGGLTADFELTRP